MALIIMNRVTLSTLKTRFQPVTHVRLAEAPTTTGVGIHPGEVVSHSNFLMALLTIVAW